MAESVEASEDKIHFKTFQGAELPYVSWENLMDFISDHRRTTRVVEASAINMAMVARHCLGLKALGGKIGGIVTDSLAGWITAATLRNLANSGAEVTALSISDAVSFNLKSELDLLAKTEAKILQLKSPENLKDFHAVLLGILDSGTIIAKNNENIWQELNEKTVPVLSVLPPVADLSKSEPLVYASSTLFLGLPQEISPKLKDALGRSYLCDISLDIGKSEQGSYPKGLFSEQPVVQIYQFEAKN
jgi:hypothetical protein